MFVKICDFQLYFHEEKNEIVDRTLDMQITSLFSLLSVVIVVILII